MRMDKQFGESAAGIAAAILLLGIGCAPEPPASSEPATTEDAVREDLCQPIQGAIEVPPSLSSPSARVFWDVSASMVRFTKKDGPVALLNRSIESRILQGAGVDRFAHVLVGNEAEEVGTLPQPLRFSAMWTNLPDVAQQVASTLSDPTSDPLAILVSDMKVETPPALRKVPNATVCGDVSLPSDVNAPYVFGACFERALSHGVAPADAFVGIAKAQVREEPVFFTVVSRDASLGARVHQALVAQLPVENKDSITLLDFSQLRQPAKAGLCSFDQHQRDVQQMGRANPGQAPACHFRLRSDDSQHTLKCSVEQAPSTDLVIGTRVVGIERGGQTLTWDPASMIYQLDSNAGSAELGEAVRAQVQAELNAAGERRVRDFAVNPEAADTLVGLARALSEIHPPSGPSWMVVYDQ